MHESIVSRERGRARAEEREGETETRVRQMRRAMRPPERVYISSVGQKRAKEERDESSLKVDNKSILTGARPLSPPLLHT